MPESPSEEPLPSGHTLDEFDDHEPEQCYACLMGREVLSDCRCGECCRSLILEALPQDAEREPRIKERCSPLTGINDELEGYLLNGPDGACVFLNQQTDLCTIHPTRPLMCRLFDCQGEGREQLIELGIIERDE
jgi:Fe-S-cluster containining protein